MRSSISGSLLVVAVGALAACRGGTPTPANGATPNANAAVPVRTVPVRQETIAQPVTATGIVAAREEMPLAFKIGGVVAEVLVHDGETVRAGQTLASLDLREIDALVAKAQSGATKAERDLARVTRLHAESVATLQQLEDATTGLEVARADLEGAAVNRRYARIVAPANGVILRRAVEPGQLVAVGAAVVVFGNTASGTVFRIGLADRDVVRLALGNAATIQVDAWPDRAHRGVVRQIARSADPRTGTYEVEIAIADPTGLASGMVGHTEIATTAGERLPTVPVEALIEGDGDRAALFVVDSTGRARRVPVSIAFLRGDRAVIRSGLGGATHVVTDGAAYLGDGAAVRVVP